LIWSALDFNFICTRFFGIFAFLTCFCAFIVTSAFIIADAFAFIYTFIFIRILISTGTNTITVLVPGIIALPGFVSFTCIPCWVTSIIVARRNGTIFIIRWVSTVPIIYWISVVSVP
jgi:hypothetical protein